jgi:hypothetical protein
LKRYEYLKFRRGQEEREGGGVELILWLTRAREAARQPGDSGEEAVPVGFGGGDAQAQRGEEGGEGCLR